MRKVVRHPMFGMVVRRVGQAVLAALGACLIVWALLPLAPGDPAYRVLTAQGHQDPTPLQIEEMRRQLGVDRPLHEQFFAWFGDVVQGDLGVSFRTARPVADEFAVRMPATFLLLGTALAMAIAGALVLSLISVAARGRWPDFLIRTVTQFLASIPGFLIGLVLLQYVVVGMGIGRVLSNADPSLVWIPALALATNRTARWTQLLRANMLETLGSNFVLVARARGAGAFRVLVRYVLPNASLPFITAIGVSIGGMIGGAAIIEALFTWPGIGQYVLQGLSARDYPVIQGFVLISGLSYVAASLLVDLVAMWLDPRLRLKRQ